MPSAPRVSRSLLADTASWLVTLAALALIAALASGALAAVLTLLALAVWIASIGRFGDGTSDLTGRPRQVPHLPLVAMLVPAVVGLAVARAVADDEWYAFTALAIAFPVMVVWRELVVRWYARRGGQPAA